MTDPVPNNSAPTSPAGHAGAYGHDNNFDVLRFAMAVLVILSHCFVCALGDGDTHEPVFRLTGGRVTSGGLAVDAFFIISGFLITASWERSRSALSYVRKRACRILPGYVAAMVVSACLFGPVFSRAPGPWLSRPVLAGLGRATLTFGEPRYPGAFDTNPTPGSINVPIWTIRYEIACYALVFGLGAVGLLRWRWAILIAFAALTLGYATEYGLRLPAFVAGPGYVAKRWARLPAFFLAGTVLYLFRERVPIRAPLAAASVAVLAGTLLCRPLLPAALVLCGGYLIVWFAYQQHLRLPNFARRGDFSYGIYLYGFPIQQAIVWTSRNRIAPLALFATAAPLAVVAGAASWFAVERWFVRPKTARQPQPAPAALNV